MSNFHKPEDSVFTVGERWYDRFGNEALIVSTSLHKNNNTLEVAYILHKTCYNLETRFRDSADFQVRYTHSSERYKQRNADDN